MTAIASPPVDVGPAGPAGPAGAPGAAGPPGAPGAAGDLSFTFVQMSASAHWHIVHGLGKYPSVEVVDSGGSNVIGTIAYIDQNTLDLIFSAPFGGQAFLN